MGCSNSSSKRVVYSNTTLPQEKEKNLKQSNLTLKITGKRRIITNHVIERKGIIKIQAEINEIETKNH